MSLAAEVEVPPDLPATEGPAGTATAAIRMLVVLEAAALPVARRHYLNPTAIMVQPVEPVLLLPSAEPVVPPHRTMAALELMAAGGAAATATLVAAVTGRPG